MLRDDVGFVMRGFAKWQRLAQSAYTLTLTVKVPDGTVMRPCTLVALTVTVPAVATNAWYRTPAGVLPGTLTWTKLSTAAPGTERLKSE
jgi:hypothetical protein